MQNTPGIPAPLQAELKALSRGAQDIFSAILAAARAKESPFREVRRLAKKHSVSQNIIRATTDLIQRKRQAVTAEEKEIVVTNEQLLIKTIRAVSYTHLCRPRMQKRRCLHVQVLRDELRWRTLKLASCVGGKPSRSVGTRSGDFTIQRASNRRELLSKTLPRLGHSRAAHA